jgi:hypothetical protein
VQIAASSPFAILPGYTAGPDNQVLKRMPEFAIKMKNIKNKMFAKRPKAFPDFYILLATNMTITANYSSSTIQAVLFLTFWLMRHANFFLKIGTNMRVSILFRTIRKAFFIFEKTIS